MNLVPMNPAYIDGIWDKCSKQLAKAGFVGDDTEESLYDGIVSGHQQLWVLCDDEDIYTSLLTEVRKDGECRLLYMGGTKAMRYLDQVKVVEAWAKDIGASAIRLTTKRGIAKWFMANKYKEVGIADNKIELVKEL